MHELRRAVSFDLYIACTLLRGKFRLHTNCKKQFFIVATNSNKSSIKNKFGLTDMTFTSVLKLII